MNAGLADPLALLLLGVVAPLLWLWQLDWRRRQLAASNYGPGTAGGRSGAGRPRWRPAVMAFAVVLIVVAAARPYWGSADVPVERRGVDIAIALDVSRSMTATDVLPTRAAAASAELVTLLTHLRQDRAGLVIFAGDAFERSPLTLDMNALAQLIVKAQGEAPLVPPGTDLGRAINASLQLLAVPDRAETQLIIVVSDGEDLEAGAIDAAYRAARVGVPIFTVTAGTEAGATLVRGDQPGVRTRADRLTLETVAEVSSGEIRELDTLAGLAIELQRMRQATFGSEIVRQPIERYQWFLALAIVLLTLPLVVADARLPLLPSASILVGIPLLMLAGCSGGSTAEQVEAGNRAYEEERYEAALGAYRDAAEAEPGEPRIGFNLGNTLHQLRRFEEGAVLAEEALMQTEDPELTRALHYAIGALAVQRGLLAEAKRHYIDALWLAPDDIDTKANLELVLRLIADTETPPTSQDERGARLGDGGTDGLPELNPNPGTAGSPGSGAGDSGQSQQGGGAQAGGAGSGSGSSGTGSGATGPGAAGPSGSVPGGASGAASDRDAAGEAAAAAALAEALAQPDLTAAEALVLLGLYRELARFQALDAGRGAVGAEADR